METKTLSFVVLNADDYRRKLTGKIEIYTFQRIYATEFEDREKNGGKNECFIEN